MAKRAAKGKAKAGVRRHPVRADAAPKPKRAPKPKTATPKPSRTWRRIALRGMALLAIWGVILTGGLVGFLYLTLPDLEAATRLKRGPTAAMVDRDGAFVASYGELRGELVTVAELPSYLPRAVVAIEDKRFYEHGGVDPIGIARAIFVNVSRGRLSQGASTITQQLARNLLLTNERSFGRKAREALLALELERRFGKDQILSIYLNRVYFGGGAYGVDAAARRFFGKPAKDVSLWEAALLAGSLQAPSRLAPDRNPDGAAKRARLVLNAMVDAGFVSAKMAADPIAVVSSAATARSAPVAGEARYFADWALAQAEGFMAGLDRDVLIETTLDLDLQKAAENALANGISPERGGGPPKRLPRQGAIVAIGLDGAVRAMVGGRAYVDSQFNRATQARRQLGSVFKPFVYLAAIEAGWEPDDLIEDAPVAVGKWRPRNFKDRYYGEVTLREALARSLNAAAVRLAEHVGRDRVLQAARRLGVASPLPDGPSLSLGAGAATLLEITGAYAALAAGGRQTAPYGISEIRSRSGESLYKPALGETQATSLEAARRMTNMLMAVVRQGSGVAARLDRDAAGKTGTSQRSRDGWFVGYTADLAVGVWVGNDDDSPVPGLTGGGLPARIWQDFMIAAGAQFAPKPLAGASGYAPRPRVISVAAPTRKPTQAKPVSKDKRYATEKYVQEPESDR